MTSKSCSLPPSKYQMYLKQPSVAKTESVDSPKTTRPSRLLQQGDAIHLHIRRQTRQFQERGRDIGSQHRRIDASIGDTVRIR